MRGGGRAWLLLPAGASLLGGVDAGLVLLGAPAPVSDTRLGDIHGPLMVLGFLGTLIALERASALRSLWGYAAPALLGLGGLGLLAPVPRTLGQVLLLDGAVLLLVVLVALWGRRRDDTVLVEALGAVLAALAVLLWVRVEDGVVVPLLAGFVVLTITAERVELARLHLAGGAGRTLAQLSVLVAAAALSTVLAPAGGSRAFGVVLVVLVAWLGPRDVAVRLVHGTGLPRFAATSMLMGYVWLGFAGSAWVVLGATTTTARGHDLVVHAVFLGFAMSMVLAHAPVILPAVLRRAVPYRPLFWMPLALLHVSLTVRVAGDVSGVHPLTVAGGVGTAIALLGVPIVAAGSAILAARRPPTRDATNTTLRSIPS